LLEFLKQITHILIHEPFLSFFLFFFSFLRDRCYFLFNLLIYTRLTFKIYMRLYIYIIYTGLLFKLYFICRCIEKL
jgi:hypothetical protein